MVLYTQEELDQAAIEDWMRDAIAAQSYANETLDENKKQSWLAYAKECRENIAKYSSGGAHKAMLSD